MSDDLAGTRAPPCAELVAPVPRAPVSLLRVTLDWTVDVVLGHRQVNRLCREWRRLSLYRQLRGAIPPHFANCFQQVGRRLGLWSNRRRLPVHHRQP